MTSPQDFITSYHHTLSSTFSHPSLPLVYHSQNWTACSHVITLPTPANAIAVSSDDSLLAVAAGSDVLIYHTGGDMKLSRTLKGHAGWVTHVEWVLGEGSTQLVSSSSVNGVHQEKVVRFWDLNDDPSAEVQLDLAEVGAGHVFAVQAESTTDQLPLSAPQEAQVKRSRVSLPGTIAPFSSSAFSPDGGLLFYLPTRTTVAVVCMATRLEKFRLEGHTDAIMWVGASPDGKLLATSSWDRTVKIWDREDGRLLRTLTGSRGQNWVGRWSPDGRLVAVGSGDASLRVWDAHTGRAVRVFGEQDKMFSVWVRGLAFDPAGKYAVASSIGGTVRVFDVDSGACTNHYQIDPAASSPMRPGVAASYMEISQSLKHAASGARFGFKPTDGRLVVYDTAGNEMWEFVQDKEGSARDFGPGDFVFARGGMRVYSADVDGAVRVWDLD